jgi:hypothetical protein
MGTSYLEPITKTFQSKSGRFVWSDLDAGTWVAGVCAPGHQMFNVPEFTIEAGKATGEIVMPLLRGYAVRGQVVDASTGAGIAEAGIGFRVPADRYGGYGGPRSAAWAKSKDDGSFVLDGIPGGDIVLTVGAPDHAYRELPLLVDEKTPPQEITLSVGATVAGMVTTTAGAPVKGRVSLTGAIAGYSAESNEAGQFSYKHMPPGRYSLGADTSAGSAQQQLVLQQDEIKDGIVLVVGAGRTIRGVVRGPRPEQIPKTHLLFRAGLRRGLHERTSQRAWSVRVQRRTAGTRDNHRVRRRCAIREARRRADRPGRHLRHRPSRGRAPVGLVTQGGKPAPHRNIWMRSTDAKADVVYRATTSDDGEYEIEGLPPGDYRLRADEDISRAIAIAGDFVLNMEIPLVQLAARVVEDGGSVPVVGADVYLRGSAPETARVRGDKRTDDFGAVALTGIEPGEIVLIVYKSGYEMYREKIAYSSPITNKTITLRKNGGVEVRVKTGSRRFPIGFTITQSFPSNDNLIDIWVPLDRERVGHVPSALAGTTFQIGRFSGQPLVYEDWDGQPFELP